MKGNFHVRFGERDVETRLPYGEKVRRVPTLHLIRMVPHEEREQFVNDLTYNTVEDFFDARDIDTGVEWSSVFVRRMAA
jgi:hypothetical protein